MMKLKLNIWENIEEGRNMVIRKYPEEIQKAMETYKPYAKCIHDGELEGVPQEAVEAFKKVKNWAWEQGQ